MCCGDIVNVETMGTKFVAHTQEEFNFSMLSQDYAKTEIEKAFRFFGQNLAFEIVLDEKKIDKVQSDIDKLKHMFNNVKIIK